MAAPSRVKVRTDKLLKAVKARRATEVARYKREAEQHDAKIKAYGVKVAEALRKAADAAEKGHLPQSDGRYREGGSGVRITLRAKRPNEPSASTDGIDRLIQTLEMAADPTIVISATDAAKYLG